MSRLVLVALVLASVGVSDRRANAQVPAVDPAAPVSIYGVVPAGVEAQGSAAGEQMQPAATDARQTSRRGEWVFAPLPMVNPTLENGLFVATGYIYRINREDFATPPSITGVGMFGTSNDSWGGAFLQKLHLAHDRVRILAVAGYADVNIPFYGIGEDAGDAGVSIQLNQAGPIGLFDTLVRVAPRWYVGARYQFLDMSVTSGGLTLPDGPTLPGADAKLRTASLGPRVDYDSRDSTFYPRHGTQLQGIANFYGEAVGGRRTYQGYQASINRYHGIGARHVLAWHLGGCGAVGSVPFYDLCMLGKNQDLRGYPLGQYRDRAMVAAQAEWRSEIWWRLGAVAFAGTGQVAERFDRLTWKDMLPGGGAGLRFVLADRNHVNLRVDYAWGKNSSALYIGVIEAF